MSTVDPVGFAGELKVLTLNLAHARGRALNSWFLRRSRICRNLDRVSDVLRREQPDVVTLQEADGPSTHTGRFNHVEYLARAAGFPYYAWGEHVLRRRGVHGTAILSRLPLADPVSICFPPSPPSSRKGLVLGRIAWPGVPDLWVDVAAVHLDFLRPTVRRRQVRHMVAQLFDRNCPRIIMGDFNCSWGGREESLRLLAGQLDLRPCQPDNRRLLTFPRLLRRLDWILVSPHFEFAEYRNLPDRISDHRAVLAVLRLVR